jgi:mannose-6-phosphate isomerase-like protein (cupin superfamily)
MEKNSRYIENPVNGEKITFLKTTEDTNGEYLLYEIDLQVKGKVPLHYHTKFQERFKAIEGELGLQVGKETIMLSPGQEITVKPGTVHRFFNPGNKAVKFENEMRPAGEFEKAMRAGDGLAADGKANKAGLPKNILHLALIFQWVGSYFPGVPVSIQEGLFGFLAKIAKRRGMDKELEKYF